LNSESLDGLTVADVMLRRPKTLPSSASVGDVRDLLEHASVQMVLLADGSRFAGAITSFPADASDDEPAAAYADASPETLAESDPAQAAFDAAARRPDRRIVVLGEQQELLGLVCLDKTRTHFCGGSRHAA
jgi:hypothetical protein